MISILRTDSDHQDFVALVRLLDAHLAVLDGAEHAFYAQYNKIDKIRHVLLAYDADRAVACGAIREYAPGSMEVKRMFTLPEYRGRGIAGQVLTGLEAWAAELSYEKCILETGKRQPDAIALYTKHGYHQIPNYGQYAGLDNSLCFEKFLATHIDR
jgi:putative acetyltransferase